MSIMLISLAFIIGFIVGGLIVFLAMLKFSSKHKLLDEMTQIKRANANKDRMVVEFFERAEEQFSILNKVYLNYAKFMQNNANRFMLQDTVFVKDNLQNDDTNTLKSTNEKSTNFVPQDDKDTSFVPEISSNDANSMAYVQKLEKDDIKAKSPETKKPSLDDKKDILEDEIIDDISVVNAIKKTDESNDSKDFSEKVSNESLNTKAQNEIKI